MKNTLIIATIVCFLLAPLQATAYSPPDGQNVPPVEQALVREGDFALKLAQALGLGTQIDEVEAMGALGAAGVAPGAGWIADYPVTPDILGELEAAVADAAHAGRLAASEEEAMYAFQEVAAGFGLVVAAAPQKGDLQEEPPRTYPPYTDPAVVHHHYYTVGPPVVTYYPPPRDYFYLYGWVPYPFYWRSHWFPGFFILHDFHRVVFVRQRTVKVVTNHVFVPRARKAVVVDHRSRTRGKVFEDRRMFRDRRSFDSVEAGRGARSIVERSRSRERLRDPSPAVESRRPSGRPTGVQRPERRREALSGNRGVRSFNRPDSSIGPGGRSFDRPSGSGRRRSDAISADPGRSSQSFRGSSGSSSVRSSTGSGREGAGREMRAGGSSGRGSPGREMRGGGSRGRGDFARGGSRGSECRGRC